MNPSLVVIIPAHNEESGIAATLRSLQKSGEAAIVVIADNCQDRTAEIAHEHGVRVIERTHALEKGKPYALSYALDILIPEGYLYFSFIDADSSVEPNFVEVVLSEFKKGADAIQVRYAQVQNDSSLRQRLLDIAFFATNTLKPIARRYWGLSSGIVGNGFAVTRETILAVPFKIDSLIEDVVYHIRLVSSGKRVIFTTETTVWAPLATGEAAVRAQRARWEGGRLVSLKKELPLLTGLVLRGNGRLIEPLLDLLLPPLGIYILMTLLLFLFPWPWIHIYAWMNLGCAAAYVMTAVYLRGSSVKDWQALCLSPLYLLWKITMIPSLIQTVVNQKWQRTARKNKNE